MFSYVKLYYPLVIFSILFFSSNQAEAKIFIKPFDSIGVRASGDLTVPCPSGEVMVASGGGVWACGTAGGTGAPTTAQYVVSALDGTLSAEDLLTAGKYIQISNESGIARVSVDAQVAVSIDVMALASHDAVTLTGETYLTLSGQQITEGTINDTNLTAEDFGDFTCDSGEDGCLIDANAVALTTDTTGNYAAGDAEAGAATNIQDDLIVAADFADADWGDGSIASNVFNLDADVVSNDELAPQAVSTDQLLAVNKPTDGQVFSYDSTLLRGEWITSVASEVNNLETITTGIATTEIPIGTAADTAVYAALGGDVTMTNGGVVTIGANAVALTTDTTGNYVASVATTSPITGGAAGSEGATLTVAIPAAQAGVNGYMPGVSMTSIDVLVTASHDAVTLTGENYLTLSGQQITMGTISDTHLTAEDFGDFTCDSGEDGCLIDANAVALTTDTTGNYAAGDAEAGAALTGDSATSFFSTGTLEVGIGGTGVATVTDGGVLIGKGTAAFANTGVLADGTIIIGDGVTNPTTLAAFSSATGTLSAAQFPILAGDVTTPGASLTTNIAADVVSNDELAPQAVSTDQLLAVNKPTDGQVFSYEADNLGGKWIASAGGFTNLTDFDTQTAWRVFYSDGNGDTTELALGADNTVLTSTGAASAPAFEAASGSSTFNWIIRPQTAKLPLDNPAAIDAGTPGWRLLFDDTAGEKVSFDTLIVPSYAGGNISMDIQYTAAATSGKVSWAVFGECITPGDSTIVDAGSFGGQSSSNQTVPGTAGYLAQMGVSLGNPDSCSQGDRFRLMVSRDVVSTDDTHVGDIAVRSLRVYEQ